VAKAMDHIPGGTAWGALKHIYRFMSPRRRRHFYVSLGLMAVGAVAEMVTIGAVLPFLALISGSDMIDSVPLVGRALRALGVEGGSNLLIPATILLVVVAIGTAVVRLALTWVSQKFVFRLGHDIGSEIYRRTLWQPYGAIVRRNSSEVIAGIEKVQTAVFSVLLPLLQAVIAGFMAIFIVAILIAIDPFTAAAAALGLGLVYVGVSIVTRKLLRHNSHVINDLQTNRVQLIQEGLGGIRDILIDQSQPVFHESFRRLDSNLRNAQATNVFVSQAPRFVVEAFGIILVALLAVYLSTKSGGVVAAIPVLGALALGAQRLLPLLQLVYAGWAQFAGSIGALHDVVRLLRIPIVQSKPRDPAAAAAMFRDSIVLDNVSFRYGDGDDAIRELRLAVRKGERIGILGETGSGKSTFLDLLMGLLDPSDGEIRIDGVPLGDGNRADWQSLIAHVPQVIFLADSSIAENIAFGEPSEKIDLDRVHAAAKRAQIDSFILSLPDGYETRVGERGVRLSGGQRQRIGIARALYKCSSLLILDEATSALDDKTETMVMEALSEAGRDLTIFMIAHRLSTLRGCDRLVRLDGGRIAAVGSYDELVGAAGQALGPLNKRAACD
jgi:ATP-binding cassette subfamily B protein